MVHHDPEAQHIHSMSEGREIRKQKPDLEVVAEGMMTVAEVADALRLSRTTVYQLFETGQLAYCRFGRSRRIPKLAVLELAASKLTGGWSTGPVR
jgi:excisionase family DNA binding protein